MAFRYFSSTRFLLQASRRRRSACPAYLTSIRMVGSVAAGGEAGSGAGRGGGTGGSIRDAGGAFGKMEAAHEEQYFRKMQQELLAKIKIEHQEQCLYHDEEMRFHEEAISRHSESIERHRVLKSQHEATLRQHEGEEKQQLFNKRNGKTL